MIFLTIRNGHLCVEQNGRVLGSFTHSEEERKRLAAFIRERGWSEDTVVMCSSSMDFANEDGWPTQDARTFFANAWAEALLPEGG